jgi:hypothetical protein
MRARSVARRAFSMALPVKHGDAIYAEGAAERDLCGRNRRKPAYKNRPEKTDPVCHARRGALTGLDCPCKQQRHVADSVLGWSCGWFRSR